MADLRPSKALSTLVDELGSGRYETRSVYEFFVEDEAIGSPDHVTAVLRIDVDRGLHLVVPIAEILERTGLRASFYFLTHPDRYYPIWDTEVPKTIAEMGFEVGVHSDHYYESLTLGKDAVAELRADVKRLSDTIGGPVRGVTYHGHDEINALSVLNWDPYKHLDPDELGLAYHDGYSSSYIRPGSTRWTPKTTAKVSDFTLRTPAVWRYYPAYPTKVLRQARIGDSVHVVFHPVTVIDSVRWNSPWNEAPALEPGVLTKTRRYLAIRWRLQLGLPTPKRVVSKLFRLRRLSRLAF